MEPKHTGTVEIGTKRLILRRFRMRDTRDVFENWACDALATEFLSWGPHGRVGESKAFVKSWVKAYKNETSYIWAIELRETGRVIGVIDLHGLDFKHHRGEFGYVLSRKYWGKGYMTEALAACSSYLLLVVGLNKVAAMHEAGNAASGRVMEKAGFKREGRLRAHAYLRGEYRDMEYYELLRSDLLN